jgi:hypothetical protein
MILVTLVCALVLVMALSIIVFGRTRRRPATLAGDVHSMRVTLERRVREGADFRF